MRTRLLALLAALLCAMDPVFAQFITVHGGPTYTSGVGGFKGGWVTGVNNAGTAIGIALRYDAADAEIGLSAIRWDGSGAAATELGNLGPGLNGYANSYANAINNAGTIVGSVEVSDTVSGGTLGYRAVRWESLSTVATELGNLGKDGEGFTYSDVYAINDAGTAIGTANKYDAAGEYLTSPAVYWVALDTIANEFELGNLGTDIDGNTIGAAFAINIGGAVAGYIEKYGGSGEYLGSRSVRWATVNSAPTELGILSTDLDGSTESSAYAINAVGTVAGWVDMYDNEGAHQGYRAVRWDASSTVATELGNLGTDSDGFAISFADAVNNAGTIVGYAEKYDGSGGYLGGRAVRWDATGTSVTELGDLGTDPDGITNSEAYDVHWSGIAIGYAEKYDGSGALLGNRAVYWSRDGLAVDLNTLIDPLSGWTLEYANFISDTGWITGTGTFAPDGPGGQDEYERLFLLQVPALGILPGDYNGNGKVDAADYTVWRDNLAADESVLPPGSTNDGSGFVDAGDYATWKANFGTNPAAFNGVDAANVPEPNALILLAAMVSGAWILRVRQ